MTATPGGDAPARIDRYEILGELGRGSMGIVYLAWDPNTGRKVALKRIVPPRAASAEEEDEARARFLLEARASGRLQHAGIVTLFDADAEDSTGLPYLVMEWVEGRSLSALLKERGALPWPEAARIAAAVGRALDHAHERGIVHRDVKPANVLLADDGTVKMSDFSIAKIATESHTLTGLVLGTPNYMSPEQVRGDPVDGRSDLFGLGSMLYEMLAGTPPFKGDSVASISYKLVHVEPAPVAAVGREVPPALQAVVRRALEKDPARRYQSGRELAEAIESAARGGGAEPVEDVAPPASAAPPRPPPAVVPPAIAAAPTLAGPGRRRRTGAALRLAAGALAIAGVVGLGLWLGGRRPAGVPRHSAAAAPAPAAVAPPAPGPRPAGPETTRAAAATSAPRAAVPAATLSLLYYNRLRRGSIGVWVDGERVWGAPLAAPRRFFGRVEGEPVRAALSVAPGEHTVEVHISQPGARIEASGVVRSDFAPGRTRLLRVTLVPFVPRLGLDWEP